MTAPPTSTCFYCSGPGPFSDEHVVPASIGADDRNWLLKGCVCENCNTRVFSRLEVKFARSSPFYLARLALQPHTRKRGSKTKPPEAQLRESLYFEPQLNRIQEAVIKHGANGLRPHCLPQVHLLAGPQGKLAFDVAGPDADTVTCFLTDLQNALGERALLVEKHSQDKAARYTVHRLRRQGERYSIEGSIDEQPPPRGAIWLAPLAPVRSYAASTGATVTPRLFRHESGSLTCRCDDAEKAALILSAIADEVPGWIVPKGAPVHSTATPAYRQTLAYDLNAYCRVLAKIGLNVIAKTSGLNVVRQRHFDRARTYVLHGTSRLLMRPGRDGQVPEALEPLAPNRHLIGIEVERRAGMEAVRAVFRLYGGPVHQIRLAGTCGRTIGVTPVWLSVDYVNHRVERH